MKEARFEEFINLKQGFMSVRDYPEVRKTLQHRKSHLVGSVAFYMGGMYD